MNKFKRHRYGFWDQDIQLSKLSALGDPLEKLRTGDELLKITGVR